MATYKVIQDIEAEDKLVGPLTLRQFIYAAITVICLYICFIGVSKNAAFVVIPIFLPPAFVTGFFAFPWKGEQPTEIWALAKIRFMVKPRRRIWDQSGVKELVTVTAPKKIEQNFTNGLSQIEVRSRLKALADTIDSRGWAIKNVDASTFNNPIPSVVPSSDRLLGVAAMPQEVPSVDVRASDDMLDEKNNPVAQQFDAMITQAAENHREQVIQAMNQAQAAPTPVVTNTPVAPTMPAITPAPTQPAQQNDYWFMNQPSTSSTAQVVAPGITENTTMVAPHAAEPTADERALAERLRAQNNTQQVSYAHLHTIQPLSVQEAQAKARAAAAAEAQKAAASAMTAQPDPAIIALASNNDLNVATIARQANRQSQESPDEVVISLH